MANVLTSWATVSLPTRGLPLWIRYFCLVSMGCSASFFLLTNCNAYLRAQSRRRTIRELRYFVSSDTTCEPCTAYWLRYQTHLAHTLWSICYTFCFLFRIYRFWKLVHRPRILTGCFVGLTIPHRKIPESRIPTRIQHSIHSAPISECLFTPHPKWICICRSYRIVDWSN